MKELTTTELALLALLKQSLFQIPFAAEGTVDWDAVLREAENQAVAGLVAGSVPDEAGEKWRLVPYRVMANSVRVCHAQKKLIELFAASGIPLAILKGTAVSVYYPNPMLRAMGDVDFIVPQESFEKAAALMEENAYTVLDGDDAEARHIGYAKDGVVFELHHHFSYADLDIEEYIVEGLGRLETASVADMRFPMLPRLANGLVLLAHMRDHLQSGMGLRQVIDWMMYVNRELSDDFWNAEFRQAAEKVGLATLAVTAARMCQLYFGLRDDLAWCAGADERLCESLLRSLLACGNFGVKLDSGKQVETVTTAFRNVGVFRYLQVAGEQNWKAYRKHRWLKPLCWLYQIFRYLRQGLASRRGQKLFRDFGESRERYEMLRKLEILKQWETKR